MSSYGNFRVAIAMVLCVRGHVLKFFVDGTRGKRLPATSSDSLPTMYGLYIISDTKFNFVDLFTYGRGWTYDLPPGAFR
jgi:hypothetical protein